MKMKYCKHCGGALDYDKRCTECGKQYFRFNKSAFAILLLSIALTCSVSAGVIKIYSANVAIERYKTSINDKKERIKKLEEKVDYLQKKSDFLDKQVAYIVEGGKNYHTYNCSKIYNSEKYAANIKVLEHENYTPCKLCH